MGEDTVPNGTHAPQTPKTAHTSQGLTEYATEPSPLSLTPRQKIKHAGVPQELLQSDGFPDVSKYYSTKVVLNRYCKW
jgi:hypothetical protein